MRKAKLFLVTACLSAVMCMTSFAGEWKQNETGWWYQNDDGTYVKENWMEINEKWYYFDENGYMQTGWVYLKSGTYYLEPSGEMRTADLVSGSTTYRFFPTGECKNPWGDTKQNADGTNDYSNWVPFIYSNSKELERGLSSGNVIYKDGHYLASPDYANARSIENDIINSLTVELSDDYIAVPDYDDDDLYNYNFDDFNNDLDGI